MRTPRTGNDWFVSTGQLPEPAQIRALLHEAYERFCGIDEGETSRVYPALARAPRDAFGICIAGTGGSVYSVGDATAGFTIMSVSKPFVFALVCDRLGAQAMREKIGVNPTGLPFNSLAAVERASDGRTNPMVNAGAIATTSLAPGETPGEKWAFLHEGLNRFAGRALAVNDDVYRSASNTNARNQSIARLLSSFERVYCDPAEAVDLYTRQCALDVTAADLAVMAATLAGGGLNPVTKVRVVAEKVCHYTLSVMTMAGMYESSGDWLYDIGLPGKSGIGGGIVAVSPGKGGLGAFAPPLDEHGNSVKGQRAAAFLSQRLGMHVFASQAADA